MLQAPIFTGTGVGVAQIASMTGFARAAGSTGPVHWVWEVRSVNGRGLDVRTRVPAGYDGLGETARTARVHLQALARDLPQSERRILAADALAQATSLKAKASGSAQEPNVIFTSSCEPLMPTRAASSMLTVATGTGGSCECS